MRLSLTHLFAKKHGSHMNRQTKSTILYVGPEEALVHRVFT